MIIVAGTFTVAPEERDAFLEERRPTMLRSRTEAGCLTYAFMADPIEPDLVVLYECWETEAHLEAHLAAAKDVPRAPVTVTPSARTVHLYPIAEAGRRPF
jgi:quinol monooxygenase YgiN